MLSYRQVLNHTSSNGVWLSEVVAMPDVDFSIQIPANTTLDTQGNPLGAAAECFVGRDKRSAGTPFLLPLGVPARCLSTVSLSLKQ